ncbi:hypothetical protein JCM8547_006496 [Rhodosporidiobolus lusitaniae]
MLDRLPTELPSHIVGLAAPLDYTPSFYPERRQFLRNACLKDAERLEEADEQGRSAASKVKLLVLRGISRDCFFLSEKVDFRPMLELCTSIIEVRVLNAGEIDLDCLPPFLRYYHNDIHSDYVPVDALDHISSALRQLTLTLASADPANPLPLRALILPTYYEPHFADSDEMDELLAACRSSGVEAVWEEQHDWSC